MGNAADIVRSKIDKRFTTTWVRMTRFLALDNGLRTLQGQNHWLWSFFTPDLSNEAPSARAKVFQAAKDQFELYPFKTIEKLEQFRADILTQEATNMFLVFLSSQSDSYRSCWYWVQKRLQDHLTGLDPLQTNADPEGHNYEIKQDSFVSDGEPEEHTSLVQQVRDFVIGYQAEFAEVKNTNMTTSGPHERALVNIFLEAAELWPAEVISILSRFSTIAGHAYSSHNSFEGVKGYPLYILFADNLDIFALLITGEATRYNALSKLRLIAQQKMQQWGVVYQEIENLRSTIEEQRQVITCLEYRHLLEHLPPDRIRGRNSGPRWMLLWDEIVNDELDLQLVGDFGPRHLTPLFQVKVMDLSAARRALVQTEIANQHAAAIQATAAAGILATVTRPSRIAKRVNSDPANIALGNCIPYREWPGYARGRDLFSELSETIHGYGKKYEFQATNWSKSEQHILAWLKPTKFRPDERDVAWAEDRAEKKIAEVI
ncbi:hypothetical protein BKA66DRAFT_573494 [Pyrenochaeta sp. MPI-SDFR-AT-0127]|nr:hypothetical protein BKA66DRAFT_573494 [Pyrenochaeta sp. MPI-SDFR-AT-0127]